MKILLVVLLAVLASATASTERKVMFDRKVFPSAWNMVGFPDPEANIKFMVALHQRNLDKLEAKFWAVSDPASPDYQNYMTKEEVDTLIAPCPLQKQVVHDWLVSCGCPKIEDFGDAFAVSVPVKMAETIFQTKFYLFRHSERESFVIIRQMGEYSIPATVSSNIYMITGVSDFPVLHNPKVYGPEQTTGIVPDTLRVVYNIPATANATGTSEGVAEYGGGEDFDVPSLQLFASQVSGTPYVPLENDHIITPIAGEGIEGDLDIQYLSAIAQGGVNWYWTQADWLYDWALTFFQAKSRPDIISISYGWWEGDQCDIDSTECQNLGVDSTGYVVRVNTEFQKIGVVGVSLLCASGDSGANGRTDPDCSVPRLRPAYPASSPYITSVGATQLVNPVYNLQNAPPACNGQGYTCASGGQETAVSFDVASFTSGGGFSDIAPRPSYQNAAVEFYLNGSAGVQLPPASYFNQTGRGLPDVASLGTAILIESSSQLTSVGGTSASSPSFAGYMSLLNAISRRKTTKPLGFLNPFLYKMYAEHPAAFRDITVGDNICTEQGCSSGCQGYYASKGWDPVTGLGVANVAEMIKYLSAMLDSKITAETA